MVSLFLCPNMALSFLSGELLLNYSNLIRSPYGKLTLFPGVDEAMELQLNFKGCEKSV